MFIYCFIYSHFHDLLFPILDFKSGSRWVKFRLDRNSSFLKNLYKISELSLSNILHKGLTSSQTKDWCARLLSVLANYTWLIKVKFVSPLDLVSSFDQTFIGAINYFLENLVQDDEGFIPDAMEIDGEEFSIKNIGSDNVLTPAEKLQWITQKIQVIKCLIEFAVVLLKETDPNNSGPIWNSNIFEKQFYKLLGNCLLRPNSIGLNQLSDDTIKRNLLIKQSGTLFELFKEFSVNNETQLKQLAQELAEIALSDEVNLLNIELDNSGM